MHPSNSWVRQSVNSSKEKRSFNSAVLKVLVTLCSCPSIKESLNAVFVICLWYIFSARMSVSVFTQEMRGLGIPSMVPVLRSFNERFSWRWIPHVLELRGTTTHVKKRYIFTSERWPSRQTLAIAVLIQYNQNRRVWMDARYQGTLLVKCWIPINIE